MIIRLMTENDIQEVQEIAYASYGTTYKNLLPIQVQEDFILLAYSRERLKQRMKSSIFYVAERNGEIEGFVNFSRIDQQGNSELLAMYIEVKNQRQKIGTALLNKLSMDYSIVKTITANIEAENTVGMLFAKSKDFYTIESFIDDFQGVYLNMKRIRQFVRREGSNV